MKIEYIQLLLLYMFHSCSSLHNTEKEVYIPGDVIIGGLSPIHYPALKKDGLCNGVFNTRGLQNVEAMIFAIEKINKNNSLLPGITLGLHVRDTCCSPDFAVRQVLNFSFVKSSGACNSTCNRKNDVRNDATVSLVGAAYSGVSMAVAGLAGLFHVPVISYASTSRLLSNKNRFSSFLRTVPSDVFQAQVMVDLLRKFKWNLIVTLGSDTDYGRSGIQAVKDIIAQTGSDLCIVVDELFTDSTPEMEMKEMFERIKSHSKSHVIVTFAQVQDAYYLVNQARLHGMTGYTWIASDGWAGSREILHGNEDILDGMFGINPECHVINEFNEYFRSLSAERIKRNVWLQEHLEISNVTDDVMSNFQHYTYAPHVIDAVYTIAHGLHSFYDCDHERCIKEKMKYNHNGLFDHIKSVHFSGMTSEHVMFDSQGGIPGTYDIFNLHSSNQSNEYREVGKWKLSQIPTFKHHGINEGKLTLDLDAIHWSFEGMTLEHKIPMLSCSIECKHGFFREQNTNFPKCCWDCQACAEGSIAKTTEATSCTECAKGTWPNENKTSCVTIQPTFLHWQSTEANVIIALSSCGVLLILWTFVILQKYRETPLVKASNIHLCFMLLCGLLWTFLTPLVHVLEPSNFSCIALPYISGINFPLVIGTLLMKTHRIARIFSIRYVSELAEKRRTLKNQWNFFIITWLVVVEIINCTVWVIVGNAQSILYYPASRREVIKQCENTSQTGLILWWAYNISISIICTHQTFKTRKLPSNYNETRFILFSMTVICIIVLIFIPTYLGTTGVYRQTLQCSAFLISAMVVYFSIFGPKLYIILFRPDKNVPYGGVSIKNGVVLSPSMQGSISGAVCNHSDNLLRVPEHISSHSNNSFISSDYIEALSEKNTATGMKDDIKKDRYHDDAYSKRETYRNKMYAKDSDDNKSLVLRNYGNSTGNHPYIDIPVVQITIQQELRRRSMSDPRRMERVLTEYKKSGSKQCFKYAQHPLK